MPSTLVQVAIFLLLGLPGLTWLFVRERRVPRWTRTTLREAAEFVTISAIANSLGLILSLWLWQAVSSFAAKPLLVDVATYYRLEPVLTLAWLGSGLIIATAISAAMGFASTLPTAERRNNLPPWYFAFQQKPSPPAGVTDGLHESSESPSTLVICRLDDGTEITGMATYYTDDPGLEGKRDILLLAPVIKWPDGSDKRDGSTGESIVVINEQRIRWFTTTCLTPELSRAYIIQVQGSRVNDHAD